MPQTHDPKLPELIEFNRPRKYRPIRVLGKGACGETVLLRDDEMGVDLVAKKYKPIPAIQNDAALFDELLDRFRDEARILFQLNHPNVVRVFNYYDYRDSHTSYIVMEYVSGTDLLRYVKENPMNSDRVFEKVVDGFTHLERKKILHRDIRPANILVGDEGDPKVIDFGFGKQIDFGEEGDKSISLNWWCEPPPEFADAIYDFQSEVYFVGKLFEFAIRENSLSDFKYTDLVRTMSVADRKERFGSFSAVQKALAQGRFDELDFSEREIDAYRKFADSLSLLFVSIEQDSAYRTDVSELIDHLERLYRSTMLERQLATPHKLGQVFVSGAFRYKPKTEIEVDVLLNFLNMLRSLSGEKRGIVVANIFARLDAIARSTRSPDDEIPF